MLGAWPNAIVSKVMLLFGRMQPPNRRAGARLQACVCWPTPSPGSAHAKRTPATASRHRRGTWPGPARASMRSAGRTVGAATVRMPWRRNCGPAPRGSAVSSGVLLPPWHEQGGSIGEQPHGPTPGPYRTRSTTRERRGRAIQNGHHAPLDLVQHAARVLAELPTRREKSHDVPDAMLHQRCASLLGNPWETLLPQLPQKARQAPAMAMRTMHVGLWPA